MKSVRIWRSGWGGLVFEGLRKAVTSGSLRRTLLRGITASQGLRLLCILVNLSKSRHSLVMFPMCVTDLLAIILLVFDFETRYLIFIFIFIFTLFRK